jgi:hypothetical protein
MMRRFVWPVAECLEASRPVKAPGDITLGTSIPFCPVQVMKTLMKSMSFAVSSPCFALSILQHIAQTKLNYQSCWCRMKKPLPVHFMYHLHHGRENLRQKGQA